MNSFIDKVSSKIEESKQESCSFHLNFDKLNQKQADRKLNKLIKPIAVSKPLFLREVKESGMVEESRPSLDEQGSLAPALKRQKASRNLFASY